ncbi:hypothetical protein DFR29_107330 [Tahibacter aquaticus]|uniref:Uncharacterized protein n=1 Tax=Tahibacter aquaticus TaxID=520092 RepID=A0A4R6YWU6_9GAMM|nr:hypothetical protein DFR29_107330 [Tahibacter aquaticus]
MMGEQHDALSPRRAWERGLEQDAQAREPYPGEPHTPEPRP